MGSLRTFAILFKDFAKLALFKCKVELKYPLVIMDVSKPLQAIKRINFGVVSDTLEAYEQLDQCIQDFRSKHKRK